MYNLIKAVLLTTVACQASAQNMIREMPNKANLAFEKDSQNFPGKNKIATKPDLNLLEGTDAKQMGILKEKNINLTNVRPKYFSGGHDGNGGDTYLTQFRESFVIAADIMKRTENLEGLSDRLNQVFLSFKNIWAQRLEAKPEVSESDQPLLVDNVEKAAVASSSRGNIEMNIPYWEKRPVSMIQSIVLAIHETGHLENVPLTHRELDEIGFALVQQNLKSYFGLNGLKKISEAHKDLAPRDKVIMFFNDANAPATLANDFSFYRKDRKRECIIFPPKQEIIYSHPVWFYRDDIILAPDSPLFPGGKKQPVVYSSFRSDGSSRPNLKPTENEMEQTERSLNVTYWGEVSMDSDQRVSWAWLRYEFRKNGELLVFKLNMDNSKLDSYGYCWDKKNRN